MNIDLNHEPADEEYKAEHKRSAAAHTIMSEINDSFGSRLCESPTVGLQALSRLMGFVIAYGFNEKDHEGVLEIQSRLIEDATARWGKLLIAGNKTN